jgi:hypothetical protein
MDKFWRAFIVGSFYAVNVPLIIVLTIIGSLYQVYLCIRYEGWDDFAYLYKELIDTLYEAHKCMMYFVKTGDFPTSIVDIPEDEG